MTSATLAKSASDTIPNANPLGAKGTSKSSTQSLAQNFSTFLTMLTTQLTHQDPLSPMDSTQFTNQLVQFSSVEQQINTNTNLTTLIGLQKTNQLSSAVGYIGHTVEVNTDQLAVQGGLGGFSYTLDKAAKSNVVTIKDSTGVTVKQFNGETTAGRHEYTWDGKSDDGTQLPDGSYSVTVTPLAEDDKTAIGSAVTTYGKVTDIGSDSTNGTVVSLNGVVVGLDKILTIRQPLSASSTTNSNSSSSGS